MSAANVGEAADIAEDFAKLIGTFPGDGESTDASRTDATGGTVIGILRDVVLAFDSRQEFFQQET